MVVFLFLVIFIEVGVKVCRFCCFDKVNLFINVIVLLLEEELFVVFVDEEICGMYFCFFLECGISFIEVVLEVL